MKKIWIYLLGVLSGVVLTSLALFTLFLINKASSSDITFFDDPGEIVTTQFFDRTKVVTGFEVFQVLDDGVALATGSEWYTRDLIVLLWNNKGERYYDNQSIVAPKGKCFRQIGIYKYESMDKTHRTIPVVALMDNDVTEENETQDNNRSNNDNSMFFFDKPGEVMSDKSYEVSRVVSNGAALARGQDKYGYYYGLEVLLWDEEANYYDDQIVKAPNGKCFRQIGIYKNGICTYPIVKLDESNYEQKPETKKVANKVEKTKNNNFETNGKAESHTIESNNAKLDKNKAYRLVKD